MLAKGAMALTVLTATAYQTDVQFNIAIEQETEPSITVLAEPLNPENSHKATLLLVGFNTTDAKPFGTSMQRAIQEYADGLLLSFDYNNAPLDGHAQYKTALKFLKERDITTVSVVTQSMGDEPGFEVAADLFTQSPLLVESITSYVGPVGYDTLRPSVQSEYDLANFLAAVMPSLAHSTPGRHGLEYWFYRDVFMKDGFNLQKFLKLSEQVQERFNNGLFTTNSFLLSQIEAITNSGIKENIEAIAENPLNKPLPRFIYFGANEKEGGYDNTVDNKRAMRKMCTYVTKAAMDCFTREVPGITHAEYYRSVDEYEAAAQAIARQIEYVDSVRASLEADSTTSPL